MVRRAGLTLIELILGIAALGVAGILVLGVSAAAPQPLATQSAAPGTTPAASEASLETCGLVGLPSGLQYIDLVVGKGDAPKAGQQLVVHYTGTLKDGTKFDSSLDRGEPFSFTFGQGQVIKGWDEGLATMKPGGKRTLTIPPDLAYGAGGIPDGSIPPNATLHFDVELLRVE